MLSSIVKVKYWPPETIFSKDGNGEPHGMLEKTVNIDNELQKRRLSEFVGNYQKNPVPAKFNLYSIINIPPNSFVLDNFVTRKILMAILVKYLKPFCREIMYKPNIILDIEQNNIFFYYNKGHTEFPGIDNNKIHLFPKNNYLLYCLLQLGQFYRYVYAKYPENEFCFKTPLLTHNCHLKKEDTYFRQLSASGGIVAPIVVYSSSNPEIRDFLLRGISYIFRGQENILGYLDTNGTEKLSPFNVRINRLISYSANDRNEACDTMLNKIGEGVFSDWSTKYEIPQWYKSMQEGCVSQQEKTNQTSQYLLGMDACDQNIAIDYEAKCAKEPLDENKKYCFLSTKANPLSNPFPYIGVQGPAVEENENVILTPSLNDVVSSSGGKRTAKRGKKKRANKTISYRD